MFNSEVGFIYVITGTGLVSAILEKFLKRIGQDEACNNLKFITELIIAGFIVTLAFKIFGNTYNIFTF